MKKVIAVSALAMAGMFSAQTLADESKTGFYVTGRAGASVMSLSETTFSLMVKGHGRINKKAVTKVDTVFGAGLAVGYDFYQHYNVPVRTEVEFYGRGNAESKYRLSYWESVGGAEFDDAQNKLSVNTLMLNAYYLISETAVHSRHGYLLVWVMLGFIIKLRTYIPITVRQAVKYIQLQRQNTKITFAWSLGVGVKYDVTQDFSLDLSYRYLDAGIPL
ncbi:outer membrane beta-barrel protein [Escherichia coli]|nr:outer membrane beta-barrel protein [Escherichia coli]